MKGRKLLAALTACALLSGTALAGAVRPAAQKDVPASFTLEDVSDSELTATLYEEMCYSADEIDGLSAGDTITCADGEVTVESIEEVAGDVLINGGYDEGGITLRRSGAMYRAMEYDDCVEMVSLGKSALPLASEVTVEHYVMDGEGTPMAEDRVDTVPAAAVRDVLAEYGSGYYSEQATRLTLEDGRIDRITVEWIP